MNVLVAISKGMWVVKLCYSKILQFLTGGANCKITQVDLSSGHKAVVCGYVIGSTPKVTSGQSNLT